MSLDALGRVIVGSGHFLSTAAPAIAHGAQLAQTARPVADLGNRVIVGAGHGAGPAPTSINGRSAGFAQGTVSRGVYENESRAWEAFNDWRSKEDAHIEKEAKELGLAALSAASGDIGGTLEHTTEAAAEMAMSLLDRWSYEARQLSDWLRDHEH